MIHSPKFWTLVIIAVALGAFGGMWATFDTAYGGRLFEWQWSKVVIVAVVAGVFVGIIAGLVHRFRRD